MGQTSGDGLAWGQGGTRHLELGRKLGVKSMEGAGIQSTVELDRSELRTRESRPGRARPGL